jgi:hypothetical protein
MSDETTSAEKQPGTPGIRVGTGRDNSPTFDARRVAEAAAEKARVAYPVDGR